MKREEYFIESQRTCPDLGSFHLNILHMLSGAKTEFGELVDIYKKQLAYGKEIDQANLIEELADCSWYMFNTLRFLNPKADIKFFNELSDAFQPFRSEILETFEKPYIDKAPMISIVLAAVTTVEQRLNSFPILREEHEDTEFLNEINSGSILSCILIWEEFMKFLGVNPEEAYEKNINKLKVRFPEKFTQENALVRDLEAERKTLE